ncbi:MAG: NAD(P)/FAD-dependent oxidoreductase [Clostridia bacterium]
MSKVAIIGGGPAGLMAAIEASKSLNNEVVVFERNEEICKKLLLTGNGRCNVTSAIPTREMIDYYYDKGDFLYSAFYQFSNHDLIQFLERNGVRTKNENNKVFPKSEKANDVRALLIDLAKSYSVKFNTNTLVKKVTLKDGFIINGELFTKLVLATGGITYKSTGSDGIGYQIAKYFGHSIEKPQPVLGSLKTTTFKELQGLSLDVESLEYYIDDVLVGREKGSIIFTHFGLSGPPVINLTYHTTCPGANHKIVIRVYSKNELGNLLRKKIKLNSSKQMSNVISQTIPSRLTNFLFSNEVLTKQAAHISNEEIDNIIEKLTNWQVKVFDVFDYDKAMATKGGIKLEEIDPKTMMSKKIDNLFFAGEILDLVGKTGGYNLQEAFSTGYVAGKTIANKGEINCG